MLIIVEGCDGSGKSTLTQFLHDLLGGTLIHMSSKTTNDKATMLGIIESAKNDVVIMDRSVYGQFIYQTEEERAEKGWLSLNDLHELEAAMIGVKVVPILCVADGNTLKQRIAQRGDSADDFDKLNQLEIQDKFIELMKKKSMLSWIKVSSKHIEWGEVK